MKQKTGSSFSKNFKAPHLFIEDLQEIEDVYKEDLKPKTYTVTTGDYKYDSVLEAVKENIITNTLRFSSYSPSIYVDFTTYSAKIDSYDHELVVIGGAEKISAIIKRRERKVYWLFFEQYLNFGMGLYTASWLIFLITRKTMILIITLTLLGIWLIAAMVSLSHLYKVSKIEFRSIRENRNFIERNKDQLAVNLITGFIGAIFGAILTIIIEHNFKFIK